MILSEVAAHKYRPSVVMATENTVHAVAPTTALGDTDRRDALAPPGGWVRKRSIALNSTVIKSLSGPVFNVNIRSTVQSSLFHCSTYVPLFNRPYFTVPHTFHSSIVLIFVWNTNKYFKTICLKMILSK